ncbi:16713_t:CDS:2 [Cetraspora pellucida]|uniref:16713_t:CDS:1 n=1 Tax=Cetraspora pellucida TaxID=1433469 RepID=A0A9N9DBG6_9GLOM|nr:16713_t:CDS:2 [Cetraspora pellucida]
MAHLTCTHIKKDGTVCGNNSWHPTECRFYSLNYQMKQKYEAEALQPKITEASISESDDSSALIHEHLFLTSLQLFADLLRRNLTDLILIKILDDRVVIKSSAPEFMKLPFLS